MIFLYLLNLLVILNSILAAKRFYRDFGALDKMLTCFVLYLSQITIVMLSLGILGIINLRNVVLLVGSMSLVCFVSFRKEFSNPFFRNGKHLYSNLSEIKSLRLVAISLSLFIGFSIVKIWQNLINPTFLWGSLIYHFTFPAEWIRNGNLTNPTILFGDIAIRYFPVNSEFLFCWFMLPLRNAFIADIVSYFFYLACAIAGFAIMRKLGLKKDLAFFSVVLFSLTPQYFKHLLFNGNDIIAASLFMIALNFILLLKDKPSFSVIVIAAASTGLLLGTKLTSMLWVPFLVVLAVYYLIINLKNVGYFKMMLLCCSFAILIFSFGGFSYIRNFLQTGNPFYPVEYSLPGLVLKGAMQFSDLRDTVSLLDIKHIEELLFHQSLGVHFAALAFPAIFLALPIILIKSKFRIKADLAYLLAMPLLMILVFYAKCPHNTPSYLYHIYVMGTMFGIFTLAGLNISHSKLSWAIFILIIAATAELAGHMMLLYSILMSALAFILIAGLKNSTIQLLYKRIFICFIAVTLLALVFLERYYEKTEYQNYIKTFHWEPDLTNGWNWVYDYTTMPMHPTNIAYAGSAAVFPLYGKKLKNNVCYVSVNEKEPYLTNFSKYNHLHESYIEWLNLMEKDGCLREKADFNVWLKNLRAKKINLLFIMSTDDFKVFPFEDEWAKNHPELFKAKLKNSRVHIYEFAG